MKWLTNYLKDWSCDCDYCVCGIIYYWINCRCRFDILHCDQQKRQVKAVTYAEVIEYFSYIRRISSLVDRKIEEKEMLYTFATKTTCTSDGMPKGKGGTSDKVGKFVVKMQEIEEEINALIDDLVDYQSEASRFAAKLPADQFEVVHMNMINSLKLGSVADIKCISYQWASKLKKRAIRGLCDIIDHSDLYEKYKNIFEKAEKVDNSC